MTMPAPPPRATGWPDLLAALLRGESLSTEDAAWAMDQVMSGDATPAQVAGFVVALKAKGETADEVAGLVEAMLRHAVRVPLTGLALDVVGTGGDRAHTVNISTMAALVAAAAGARVVKHGNRAASSQTGTADVLERLGLVIALPPEGVLSCLDAAGIGFCFAAAYHPAMRHAAAARRELGVPTVFNILGPLANPASPAAALVGCADAALAPVQAAVLAARGVRALVVRGEDGLDEVTTYAPSRVWDVTGGDGRVRRPHRPSPAGDPRAGAGSAARRGRGGERRRGPGPGGGANGGPAGRRARRRDAERGGRPVAYDAAGGGLGLGPTTLPVQDRVAAAWPRAVDALDSGRAAGVLDRWIAASRAAAPLSG